MDSIKHYDVNREFTLLILKNLETGFRKARPAEGTSQMSQECLTKQKPGMSR